jgi:hypothetical protein
MRRMTIRIGTAAAAVVGAVVGYARVVRPWHLRFGATPEEAGAPLLGDEIIPHPDLVATRAVAIAAAPDDVWPWLVQLGQGRGGFYTYDRLENAVARCDIHSADTIVADWQGTAVGDEVRLHPEVALRVERLEPGAGLVLAGGVPMGDVAAPYDFTWAFVVEPGPGGTTRLVVRERYGYTQRWSWLLVEVVEAISFVMTQKMLRSIRDLAESTPKG